ncbi:MAG: aspartate aminotransferase family protein [Chloroflexi bacterium]|nr:MAG: aspartate aminotransferase family protein [Chloroflexota bacterium]
MQSLETAQHIVDENLDYSLFSWSVQGSIKPLAVVGGQGAWFWDADGNRYLDLSSQQVICTNLGHQHPRVVQAIKDQADKMCFVAPSYASEPRGKLARKLVEITGLGKIFFTLAGADATENAIKMARLVTGRHKIITRYRSYHGSTHGAMSASGEFRRWPIEPAQAGIVRVPDPFVYRSPFGDDPETVGRKTVEWVEEVIGYEGPHTIAAMIVEGITGSNGVLIPPDNYYPLLQEVLCKHNILLIVDEVMSGFGRTGAWFAYQHWGVRPDMITMAKGLTGSYVPLGAVAVSQEIAGYFDDHMLWAGLTYAGHPLACAAGLAAIAAYEEDNLIEGARELGVVQRNRLLDMQDRHPCIGEVRSIGLFGVLELVKDRGTKEPVSPLYGPQAPSVAALTGACRSKGVDVMTRFNWVFVAPPLVISRDDLLWGLSVIDEALYVVDRSL